MHCFVYASRKRAEMYVWLAERDRFDLLPDSLQRQVGDLRPVLDVHLDPQRRLPRADAATVLAALREQGWYLQLPPADPQHPDAG